MCTSLSIVIGFRIGLGMIEYIF